MFQKTSTTRKVGVGAIAALTALSGLVFAPSAGAAPADASDLTVTALSSPSIGAGKTGQAAGALRITVTPGDTLTAGNQILLDLDDSDGSTCLAGDTLTYSGLPTVAVTGTATIVTTLETTSAIPACGTDRLRLNVTGSGTATINITNVSYNVGAAAAIGDVEVTTTLDAVAVTGSPASNAFITTALFTANNPPKGAAAFTGGSQTISPLVIAEQTATGADGDLCIEVAGDNLLEEPLVQPTVAVSGGSDTATITALDNNTLFLNVTPSGPTTASTFTINGIVLDVDNDDGLTTATVFADNDDDCTNGNGAALSDGTTTIGYAADVDRFGGSDRFATAQILFEDEFGCQDWAIIARADQFPDALAASYLAGQNGTGILLTNTNSVPQSTLNALRNEGVNNVYLMGGTQAISAAVATQLDGTTAYDCGGNPENPAATLVVERIGGIDRFETARLVAEYPGLTQGGFADINNDGDDDDAARTAILASGLNFPDALAAGSLAFGGDESICCGTFGGPIPLLLSNTTSVPADTMAALVNLGVTNVIVVGGTAAVSDAAVAQLTAAGYTTRRIAGVNRQATAVELTKVLINEFNYDDDDIEVARGDDFADALTGGPTAGNSTNPILLTGSPSSLSADTAALLRTWRTNFGDTADDFDLYGGTAAISAAVVTEILAAASQQ